MDGDREDRRNRLRSFVLGGVVGASAAFAAARRRRQVMQRRRRRVGPPGLAAFEQAPCYQELADEDGED
jgi:glycine/D-amino acid oxidase-like deaminating enzyme